MKRKSNGWERAPRSRALVVLVVLLVLAVLWGAIGWRRYRHERIDNSHLMGLEFMPFPADEPGRK